MESTGYSRRGSHSYAPKPRGMSLETEQELKARPVAMAILLKIPGFLLGM